MAVLYSSTMVKMPWISQRHDSSVKNSFPSLPTITRLVFSIYTTVWDFLKKKITIAKYKILNKFYSNI